MRSYRPCPSHGRSWTVRASLARLGRGSTNAGEESAQSLVPFPARFDKYIVLLLAWPSICPRWFLAVFDMRAIKPPTTDWTHNCLCIVSEVMQTHSLEQEIYLADSLDKVKENN